ncbi:MAG: Tn3 family transposase [Chroococcidiopsidaceae cyanobacterium CP_BM_RX_35]|nr:Tn3 family transposase [Chroococcidiopsidaceae cyanobacterium CP_BM_RX_35]
MVLNSQGELDRRAYTFCVLEGFRHAPCRRDLFVSPSLCWSDPRAKLLQGLDGLARYRVNIELITANWDDLLRVAGSLKLGTVSASELMRTLQGGGSPSTLSRAIGELGRVAKTLYLLAYVDDEAYLRRILTQLNRRESRHSLARVTFYGQRGEVRQRYREGQEDQLGALGLLVNVLVLRFSIPLLHAGVNRFNLRPQILPLALTQ